MSPALPLCNPLDVFRVRDPAADAIALRLTYHAARAAAGSAGALVERLVETRRGRAVAGREEAPPVKPGALTSLSRPGPLSRRLLSQR